MRRAMIMGAIAVLAISACANADDVDNASSSGGSGVSPMGEAGVSTDPAISTEGNLPTESIPEDPHADVNSEAATSGTAEPLSEPGDTPPPADDSDSVVLGEGLPPAVALAMADLSAYLGVSIDMIDWVSQEEVDWPDGSLGCPQPDMSYIQQIVNGSLIILEVNGVSYEYHSKAGSDPFLCLKDPGSKDGGGSGDYELPTTTVDMSG